MKKLVSLILVGLALVSGLIVTGTVEFPKAMQDALSWNIAPKPTQAKRAPLLPTVTVVRPVRTILTETVLVTGTLVAKREILIAPEIEGQRIIALLAEEGDRVKKDQVLARLDQQVILTQLAQNTAALARANAAIAQAKSNIARTQAQFQQADNALKRARILLKNRNVSTSLFEQRQSAARTAKAQLVSARDGLAVARAERSQVEARHKELNWRLSKTEIRAPAAGIISRRNAKIGSVATGAVTSRPLFHLVQAGKIELDAEVPEATMRKIRKGQIAIISTPDGLRRSGKVRLVAPEIDRTTRLGSLRISFSKSSGFRVGGFARGRITTATANALAIPLSAIVFTPVGTMAKRVVKGRVQLVAIKTGIQMNDLVAVKSGLTTEDDVVTNAGSFLRDGDVVRPVRRPSDRLSEAR